MTPTHDIARRFHSDALQCIAQEAPMTDRTPSTIGLDLDAEAHWLVSAIRSGAVGADANTRQRLHGIALLMTEARDLAYDAEDKSDRLPPSVLRRLKERWDEHVRRNPAGIVICGRVGA